ncbi:MAG: TRAP transporter small permease subunit [Melioribacteraceae bacterium]|nr:TRAP transporter small permease subunit [Melioribacteraceae bacterium]MCF8412832.1 TRAP transporter small permease subunit [Melioribacteraceae bacterium]MCF8431311.1 TRAP transporter small permease subunit [Melioribacteraceae bacterium]
MNQYLSSLKKKIDQFNETIGKATSWLTSFLVVLVCFDVFTRYILEDSSIAVQELQWHIFAIIFLLAAAYTLHADEHVRVDLFYSKLNERNQAIINLLGVLFFLLPFCIAIIISSQDFVLNSFKYGETSPDPGGLPARYILKAILPFSAFLILLQGISLLLKSFMKLFPGESN